MDGKKRVIVIILFVLLSSYLIYDLIKEEISDRSIGAVVSQNLAVSLTLTSREKGGNIPANGNFTFSDSIVKKTIPKITGLSICKQNHINLTLYGASYPPGWTEPQPTTDEVNSSIEYFEIISNCTLMSSRSIYFNITQAKLGTISANNTRLFVYNDSWTELPTTILNKTADPVSFFGNSTHFSKFVIGEMPGEGEVETPPVTIIPTAPGGSNKRTEVPIIEKLPASIEEIPEITLISILERPSIATIKLFSKTILQDYWKSIVVSIFFISLVVLLLNLPIISMKGEQNKKRKSKKK